VTGTSTDIYGIETKTKGDGSQSLTIIPAFSFRCRVSHADICRLIDKEKAAWGEAKKYEVSRS